MENRNWQSAFGKPTEAFRNQLHDALNDLEEREMKRRYKFTTMLLAAVIATALVVGAGFAASQLRVFESLGFAPLEAAEEMVLTDLGSVENDLVKFTVLEAVYDGHCSIIEMRITPRDPENYVLFDDMLNLWTDEYIIEETSKEVQDGSHRYHTDSNGVITEAPVFEKDGRIYYADHTEKKVIGRRDGKTIIDYWPVIALSEGGEYAEDSWGTGTLFDAMYAEEQPDGSIILWCTDSGSGLVRASELKLSVSIGISVDGERMTLDSVPVTLVKAEDERIVTLQPVGDGKIRDFRFIDGEIRFTPMSAYFSMNYYDWIPHYKHIYFHLYDDQGKEIRLAGGGGEETEIDENCSKVNWFMEMQPLEEIPEALQLEVRVSNDEGDEVLGRIECRVVKE